MKERLKKTRYWTPSITADIVMFTIEDGSLEVLLVKRSRSPFKSYWALPGGFLHQHEATQRAALRILREKTGVKNVYIEQLYTFDSTGRDPRGPIMTVAYFALLPRDKIRLVTNEKTQAPAFFPIKKLPRLAFNHKSILNYAYKRLGAKLEYTNIVFSFLPKYFTFSEVQKAYEVILNKKLDKRNFRKKFLLLGLIKPTTKKLTGSRQRPARLYELTKRGAVELKKFI